ncbi:B12-binding domain-containing protein [Streptacidiphilus sp. P02-A3a]|uniref:cobalamin B12-binding domain-containing protein n=1 Tax=Streptacidiphilus sp. P02-A3a TaxID=2704468 RepID=UPI002102A670|nr:cobalamin B12-binding domain-containing protein [Streptacidiphilus sp. P02-A3a]
MDEYRAVDLVLRARDSGLSAQRILLDVIAPAQALVGEEWAAARFTVAQEHAATAISDRAIAALSRHRTTSGRGTRGRVTVACVDGEWHALPARLVAETLRLRGWQVDFLGAHVPTPHLIAHLHANGPDAVALSCSLATRLPTAHATIAACQAAGVPVLVGGAAFGRHGRYARLLGADAWAADADSAATRLEDREAMTPAYRDPADPFTALPHLADQEYTLLSRSRRQLVEQTMTGLRERLPAMSGYTDQQREHTREDIGHVVDFLVAAVYIDRAEILADFLGWTADVLRARDVPAHTLLPALDVIATQLHDFPRALAIIDTGRSAVIQAGGPAHSRTTEDRV